MFEHLKKYPKIIVTGPQRSGTRICAKMIAADTGYHYFDETVLNDPSVKYPDNLPKAKDLILNDTKFVLQAPALAKNVKMLGKPNVLIVWMKRPKEEILASQQRVGWRYESYELSKYGLSEGVISDVKNAEWAALKSQIPNILEVEYSSLKEHPLWIQERKDFGACQTSL